MFSKGKRGSGCRVCEDVAVRTPEGDNPFLGTYLRDTKEMMEVVFRTFNKVGDKKDVR